VPLQIIRQDITKIKCDAIVNPSNVRLTPGGGVDAAIHDAAGSELLRECRKIGGINIGQAVITPGFKLPCKYVIHTAGPTWKDGKCGEKDLLESCYRESLKLAADNGCESIAFPLISSGQYNYPKDQVLKIAINVISDFLFTSDMMVYIVVYDKTSYEISEKLFNDITAFIDDRYIEHVRIKRRHEAFFSAPRANRYRECEPLIEACTAPAPDDMFSAQKAASAVPDLDEMIKNMDDTFAVTLMKLIDAKNMNDVECYKKANVSKQTWHKIMNDKNYKPSKTTVLSFAIALELSLDETQNLLETVGYTLSNSSKFDVIISYFLIKQIYDIFEIDETLFKFDQPTLGSCV